MTEFNDKLGRTWTIPELTLFHIQKLNKVGINVQSLIQAGYLWEDISDDAWLGIGVFAWALCQDQHEVTEEEFYLAWDGDTFMSAQEAIRTAVINFTPTTRREVIQAKAALVKEVTAMLPELIADQVERINTILSESVTSGLAKLALAIPSDTVSEPLPGLLPDVGVKPQPPLPPSSTCSEQSLELEAKTL